MASKPEKTNPPATAEAPAPEPTPEEAYRQKFNILAKRLDRQLAGLQRLASARKAQPTDDQREKALAWLEKRFSITTAAMRGTKITAGEDGIL